MSRPAAFTDFLKEQMEGFGPVSVKRMFGGAGIYRDGLMFALVADDVLYLKANDASKASFEAEGLGPFVYEAKGGKKAVMSYWRAPERCLDDPDEMAAWCGKAYAVALEATKAKPAKGETAHLLRSRANARQLRQAIAELEAGGGKVRKLKE